MLVIIVCLSNSKSLLKLINNAFPLTPMSVLLNCTFDSQVGDWLKRAIGTSSPDNVSSKFQKQYNH